MIEISQKQTKKFTYYSGGTSLQFFAVADENYAETLKDILNMLSQATAEVSVEVTRVNTEGVIKLPPSKDA